MAVFSHMLLLMPRPHNMGHGDGVNCMLMADDKIYTGGRDENLFAGASNTLCEGPCISGIANR